MIAADLVLVLVLVALVLAANQVLPAAMADWLTPIGHLAAAFLVCYVAFVVHSEANKVKWTAWFLLVVFGYCHCADWLYFRRLGRPSKVRIWYFDVFSFTSDPRFGHASLELDDGTYVSWWPTKGDRCPKKGGKASSAVQPKATAVRQLYQCTGKANPSVEQDCIDEGGTKPDRIVEVYGLDNAAMRRWWGRWSAGSNIWASTGPNCSTVVMNCLLAGGARNSYEVHRWNWNLLGGIATPLDVLAFSSAVGSLSTFLLRMVLHLLIVLMIDTVLKKYVGGWLEIPCMLAAVGSCAAGVGRFRGRGAKWWASPGQLLTW